MKTVFIYANQAALSTVADPQAEVLKLFEDTVLPHIAEHVIIFPVESVGEDLTQYHDDVVEHAKIHGDVDVFFHQVDESQLRIVSELLAQTSKVIFH